MNSAHTLSQRGLGLVSATVLLALLALAACGGQDTAENTDGTGEDISGSCDTTAVQGLAKQELDEINCIKPGTFTHITARSNLSMGPNVLPFLEKPAADALDAALLAHPEKHMTLNSGFRTLGMQYALYQGHSACGVLAALPGNSNHEGGRALDIANYGDWQSAMASHGWRWFGSADRVHFDYTAGGTDVRSLSVLAFQRLWNRSNPNDKIAEDGSYGPGTATRLAKTKGSGLPAGPTCTPP